MALSEEGCGILGPQYKASEWDRVGRRGGAGEVDRGYTHGPDGVKKRG